MAENIEQIKQACNRLVDANQRLEEARMHFAHYAGQERPARWFVPHAREYVVALQYQREAEEALIVAVARFSEEVPGG